MGPHPEHTAFVIDTEGRIWEYHGNGWWHCREERGFGYLLTAELDWLYGPVKPIEECE